MFESHKKYILLDLNTYSDLNTTQRNAYAFYISLAIKYNNSIIYNASNKRLSELTGIHYNSINKYIQILKNLDLIEFIAGNLQLKPFKKDKKLFKFYLYRSLSAKKVKEFIEIEILRLHINRQKYIIKLKKDLRENRNKMTNKRLKNNADLMHGDFNKDVHFSIRYAAKKLNVSIYKIQMLLKSNLIKTDHVYKFICKLSGFKEFLSFRTNLNKVSDQFLNLRYDFKTNKVFQLVGTNIEFKINCH